jgi:ABC-type Fe3+-hydroxamate transport system substrate-binding protein
MTTALRIASLVPSLTELVVALGLRDALVARTGFCIHPAAALRAVPKVGGTKDVNLAKLQRLAPTHVLVNVDENRRDTVEAMRAWPQPPEIVVTHPNAPHDNLALVEQLRAAFGAHAGVDEHAAALAQALRTELDATAPEGRAPQQVLYLIWRDPWMTVARDTYLSAMLARVAWHTLPDLHGGPSGAARYPVVQGDEPWLADVQQVLLSSEPYRFDADHAAEAQQLCPNARVRLVDGELLSWYGPRAVPGLRYLRALAGGAAG